MKTFWWYFGFPVTVLGIWAALTMVITVVVLLVTH